MSKVSQTLGVFFILLFAGAAAQNKKYPLILGEVKSIKNDTLTFSNAALSERYYTIPSFKAVVSNGSFKVNAPKSSYPHLFYYSLASEKGNVIYRKGDFFIDSETSFIGINIVNNSETVNGKTYYEYKTVFLPYFIKDGNTLESSSIDELLYTDKDFDTKLLNYTKQNPDSYVALWALIKGVSKKGHTSLYEDILNLFSSKIKEGSLWIKFKEDFDRLTIREHKKFPVLVLKNQKLQNDSIQIPETKYVLVDYWFSRCKPCLESFPKLKELYLKYHHLGFDIIGISVDREKDVENWKKRIKDFSLPWSQYLDVGGIEAGKEHITSFPNNLLLENGIVIDRKISLEDLEKFLNENLIL